MEKNRSGNYTSLRFTKQPRGPTSKPAGSFGVSARRAFLKAALLAGLGLPLVDEALAMNHPRQLSALERATCSSLVRASIRAAR